MRTSNIFVFFLLFLIQASFGGGLLGQDIFPYTGSRGSLEDIGYHAIKENYLVERDLPDTLWEWSVHYCGKLVNTSDLDTLNVTPIIHVKDLRNGRIKTFEGNVGDGHLTGNYCVIDSIWDEVPPGETFIFGVSSDKIRAANVNHLHNWLEISVE